MLLGSDDNGTGWLGLDLPQELSHDLCTPSSLASGVDSGYNSLDGFDGSSLKSTWLFEDQWSRGSDAPEQFEENSIYHMNGQNVDSLTNSSGPIGWGGGFKQQQSWMPDTTTPGTSLETSQEFSGPATSF